MRPMTEGGWGSQEFATIRCGKCGALVAHAHVLADGQFYVAIDGLTPLLSSTTPEPASGCQHASEVTEDQLRSALSWFRQRGRPKRLVGR